MAHRKSRTNTPRERMDAVHRFLAGFGPLVWFAVKIRNQCNAVIGHRLNDGIDARTNGEAWLIERVAPSLRRFVDVGANVGDWTALVLERAPHAFGLCFEPAPSALLVLRERARGWSRVEVVDSALSDQPARMRFVDLGGASLHSAEASLFYQGAREGRAVQVEAAALDDECSARGWETIDLLKIDAEGLDWKVLRGASKLIAGAGARVVQFEYGPGWIRTGGNLGATIAWLESFGYRVHRLHRRGLEEPRLPFFGETFSYSNYVAVAPGVELCGA